MVLSRNRTTGEQEYKRVTALTAQHRDKLIELRIEGEPDPLRPSINHPFWVLRAPSQQPAWIVADSMRAGDLVLDLKGEWHKVVSVKPLEGLQTVYNFEVDDNHDYFVGTTGFLVHNSICDLALGKTQGLTEFAENTLQGAETFNNPGMDIQNLSDIIRLIKNGWTVGVQLEEAPGVLAQELQAARDGIETANATAFELELHWIAQNPEYWGQFTWYQGSTVVTNPFE
jgi:hypothetical protein